MVVEWEDAGGVGAILSAEKFDKPSYVQHSIGSWDRSKQTTPPRLFFANRKLPSCSEADLMIFILMSCL